MWDLYKNELHLNSTGNGDGLKNNWQTCWTLHLWLVDVSGNRSFQPPCRCTVSTPHSPRHQSRAGWWRRACLGRSTVSRRFWSASGRWWWTARWRGWSPSCSDPEGRGRSPCSGRHCSPWETRSSPTSQSPQSPRKGVNAGKMKTTRHLPRHCPMSEHCGTASLTWRPQAGWQWRWNH